MGWPSDWFSGVAPTNNEVRDLYYRIDGLEENLRNVRAENRALKEDNFSLMKEDQRLKSEDQRLKNAAKIANGKNSHYVNFLQSKATKAEKSNQELQAERDQLQKAYQSVQRAWQKANEETSKARTQLTQFKSSLSTLTKSKPQITDGEVCSKVDQLFYSIQDFALKASRLAGFDVTKLSTNDFGFLKGYAKNAGYPPKVLKPYIITILLIQILVARFDTEYYFGSSQDSMINAVAQMAKAADDKDAVETKAWLEPTRKLLSIIDDAALRKSDEQLVTNAVNHFFHALGPSLDDKWPPKAENGLRKIASSAMELFKSLHQSKAVFKFDFEASGGKNYHFIGTDMQAIANEEEELKLGGRPLEMLVFPGVFKFGDEMGNNCDEITVICKARVMLKKQVHPAASMQ
ncbi:hypothetical protein LTR17_002114 [Elasticomyces elasticus]|nr:hypothetical protein LTR17_002114 [Elasticomyces elasticus]